MEILKQFFGYNSEDDDVFDWKCSSCRQGRVILDERRITIYETNESKSDLKEKPSGWNEHWVDRYFTGTMICNNSSCKEIYVISGQIDVEREDARKRDSELVEFFNPTYIYPTIHIFDIPEDTPYGIDEAIEKAFELHWIDDSACANAIRTCVELILDDKRILKTFKLKTGQKKKKTLHQRIEDFKVKNSEVGDYLMAIKWIGNAGSHSSKLTHDDILDGFELLSHAIEKLYDPSHKELIQKARIINKRKKPIGV
jgi:hypothetical protein